MIPCELASCNFRHKLAQICKLVMYLKVHLLVLFIYLHWLHHRNIKKSKNKHINTFIALKSLPCFPLDIDFNDNFNYRTNCLLRKCRKKAIAKKYHY